LKGRIYLSKTVGDRRVGNLRADVKDKGVLRTCLIYREDDQEVICLVVADTIEQLEEWERLNPHVERLSISIAKKKAKEWGGTFALPSVREEQAKPGSEETEIIEELQEADVE